jgi:nucleotide-binding universal stress UspA family protein
MYRKILIGYDGHAHARDALALARRLAAIEGAELVLVAALELDPLATPADAYERATAEAEDRLAASAREILGATPFSLRTVGGVSAPRALSEFAEAEQADVIVLGSTHRGGLGRVLPGSVGESLLHGAPCAVLIAPIGFADADGLEIDSIGVGFDGRNQAGHAREVAHGLAADLGASVETITVPEDDGDPAEVLAERSTELDLLVVGSRNHGPMRRALLGSVAAEVMRKAACPVLVVPRSGEPGIENERVR